jgi:hypothetical protein
MSILHSQLAIYRAIDDLVIQARRGAHGDADRELLKTAAALLPNSTGFGEAGWSHELEEFINLHRTEPVLDQSEPSFPELSAATEELKNVPPPGEPRRPERSDASDGQGFESRRFYDSAYDPALARAGYGAFVLAKLLQLADRGGASPDVLAELRDVLAVGIGVFTPRGGFAAGGAAADQTLSAMQAISTRAQWRSFVTDLLIPEYAVDPLFASNSLPCFGSLELIDGIYCSTVVTYSPAADVSVADVEKIIDPINWKYCCKFFCDVEQNSPNRNAEGWSKVKETISAECPKYALTADLLFYKARRADGSIFINYDLDPDPPKKHESYVKVDNGYIHVAPENTANDPNQPGVLIRTSKQERVDGLSPCATAALACLMGWADAGREMLAGTARRVADGENVGPLKPFYPSNVPDPNEMN